MLPACATLTIVAAMSEESVMKHALSPEVPARVRRGQLRAVGLGIGASLLAMACSFGSIDEDPNIDAPEDEQVDPTRDEPEATEGDEPEATEGNGNGNNGTPSSPSAGEPEEDKKYDPVNDVFSTEMGQQVEDILRVNCGNCHIGQGASGDFGYLLDMDQLITNGKVVPGNKEDSQLFVRMQQQTMPPAFERVQRPTYGQIDLVGQFIDQLEI